ncbi:hypothetical protein B0G75_107103 [Paraburkholderia sp. BL18I3N2]|nr:hypothetical protein B0G75_107103 [Paraburkholderia sp. BL18I3N2]
MHRNMEPVLRAIGENARGLAAANARQEKKRAAPCLKTAPPVGLRKAYRSTGCGSLRLLATRIASK